MEKVVVAFSGGVDSTFLVKVAHEVLQENMMAVTIRMPAVPKAECREAEEFCAREGIRHEILDLQALEIPNFSANPPDRCYYCKKAIFTGLMDFAKREGFLFVAEGSNSDDAGDYRPGMRAIRELGIRSPLLAAGLSKQEIRELSRKLGLGTWKKPSFACLASRFPYGEEITEEKLRRIERAEMLLKKLGFRQYRCRIHKDIARLELEEKEIPRILKKEIRDQVIRKLKSYGFSYVALDLQGYRTGSMNEVLTGGDEKGRVEQKTPPSKKTAPAGAAEQERADHDWIWKLETNVDDSTGEELGYLMNKLLEDGARDVSYQPIYMKKNRPAWQINVICTEERRSILENRMFKETRTLGIRRIRMERTILPRYMEEVNLRGGTVRTKVRQLPDGTRKESPEYDYVRRVAEGTECSLREIYEDVRRQRRSYPAEK